MTPESIEQSYREMLRVFIPTLRYGTEPLVCELQPSQLLPNVIPVSKKNLDGCLLGFKHDDATEKSNQKKTRNDRRLRHWEGGGIDCENQIAETVGEV